MQRTRRSIAELMGFVAGSFAAHVAGLMARNGFTAGAQPDYVPAADDAFDNWVQTFDAALTAAPTDVGETAPIATTFAGLVTTWHDAFELTLDPATRTPAAIADKDEQRLIVEPAARTIARRIQLFSGTSDAERVAFGLTIPTGMSTPSTPPATRPNVQVLTNASQQHTIRLRDESTPLSLGKPDGVVSAEIWVKVGGEAPSSILQCAYRGDATRFPFTVAFDAADEGEPAYYITRWKNAIAEVGPDSPTVKATIAA